MAYVLIHGKLKLPSPQNMYHKKVYKLKIESTS